MWTIKFLKKIYFVVFWIFILVVLYACSTEESAKNTATIENTDTLTGFIQKGVDNVLKNISEPEIPDTVINLIAFSGKSPDEDASYNFRGDIQNAINQLSEHGGGVLLFPHPQGKSAWIKQAAIYKVVGPIELRSNIELRFQPGTKLLFAFSPEAYMNNGAGVITRYEGTTHYGISALIRGFHVKNIRITATDGSGAMPVIDGSGHKWQKWCDEGQRAAIEADEKPGYLKLKDINNQGLAIKDIQMTNPEEQFLRPDLLQLFLCENVVIEKVKIANSPFWCLHPVFSQNLIFRDILFDSQNVNNDGIDPESCRNVLIENIMFYNHDDNVAIKSGRDKEGREGAIIKGTELEQIQSPYIKNGRLRGITENVVVRNCVLKGHYGFCIGSEVAGGAKNIFVVDNYSNQNVNMAVFIKSSRSRGGVIENIYIRNMKVNKVSGAAIGLVPNYDNDSISQFPPKFKNIFIDNIQVREADDGILVYGWYDKPTENIFISNVSIQRTNSLSVAYNQVKNLQLHNVVVNDSVFNGTFTKMDSTKNTPAKN